MQLHLVYLEGPYLRGLPRRFAYLGNLLTYLSNQPIYQPTCLPMLPTFCEPPLILVMNMLAILPSCLSYMKYLSKYPSTYYLIKLVSYPSTYPTSLGAYPPRLPTNYFKYLITYLGQLNCLRMSPSTHLHYLYTQATYIKNQQLKHISFIFVGN